MTRPRKRKIHAVDDVQRHLLAHYGACPEDLAEEIVGRVAGRTWTRPVRIEEAVRTVAAGLVRHSLTDYDRLLEVDGLTREEARLIVAAEVDAIIASWKRR